MRCQSIKLRSLNMTKSERTEIIAKTHLLLDRAEEIFNEMISCIEDSLEEEAKQLEIDA